MANASFPTARGLGLLRFDALMLFPQLAPETEYHQHARENDSSISESLRAAN